MAESQSVYDLHVDDLPPREKIMQARTRLLSKEMFYGTFCMEIDWIESPMEWAPENCRTMGVRINAHKRIECLWNPGFVEKESFKGVYGAIKHEIEHIIHLHCVRGGHRDPRTSNIAADMVVNGKKSKPLIGYREDEGKMILPLDGQIVFRPEGWDEQLTMEQLYEKIAKEEKTAKGQCPGCGGGPGGGSGGAGGNNPTPPDPSCPECNGQGGDSGWGRILDDHSTWRMSEVSSDEARQIVREAVRSAKEKSRGNVPGHLIEAIEKLNEPIVPWREKLRRFLGKHCGGRRKTFNRVNRRRDEFGIKGVSHHAIGQAVVVIDTSGSIGRDEMRQFWAEIEAMIAKMDISVLQWDSKFQDWWEKYRRNDWKKIKVKGGGGTDMAAPIAWLIERGQVPRRGPVIMLTDGFCNYHPKCDFPFICVITNEKGEAPTWGEVVRLKIAN